MLFESFCSEVVLVIIERCRGKYQSFEQYKIFAVFHSQCNDLFSNGESDHDSNWQISEAIWIALAPAIASYNEFQEILI